MDIAVILRVLACCIVFAYFVLTSLKSKFRHSILKTCLLVTLLIGISIVVVALFLVPDRGLSKYNLWAIFFWLLSAFLIFRNIFKGSYLEVLFIVLVVLNLYVNVVAIAKVIVNGAGMNFSDGYTGAFVTIGVLVACIPLLMVLFFGLYKKVIELHTDTSMWKVIWIIPALTYMIFYVKIVNDYWETPITSGTSDVIFIILWSFTTYTFFFVTLQLLLQAYRGVLAEEEMKLVASQLRMQEGQYRKLLDNIENTARIRHDWRHHLLTINGFAENGETGIMRDYLKKLFPVYVTDAEKSVCQNHVVDIILLHYAAIAREQGGTMEIEVDIPNNVAVSDTDLCIVFGNLVENAVEASMSPDCEKQLVIVKAYIKGTQLIIMVKNTFSGSLVIQNNAYFSTKHEGIGIGISSVRGVVEKYNGSMKTEHDNEYFNVFVLLETEQK